MVTITLHSVEEQLRSITDAFTLEDWKSQVKLRLVEIETKIQLTLTGSNIAKNT